MAKFGKITPMVDQQPLAIVRVPHLAVRGAFAFLPASAFAAVLWLMLLFDLPLAITSDWIPALGIDLAWRIDGLAMLMLIMITGIGTAVFVYAGGYMAGHPSQFRLFVLLTLFMATMIGCVTADNLILLFLFWESTSILSFLLIGLNHERSEARKAAQQALLVTGTGGLALVTGFIVLGMAMGSFSISAIVEALPHRQPTPQLTAALLLILVGAFTKSAQFPFHFWLPNAMSAPTPVSAYLHSATMVKLGVFLLARLDPGFGAWPLWMMLLQIIGSLTAAWAMVLTLRERDLKRILAWSTVATLGTLVTLVGMPGEGASAAVGALLLAHALYKAPLFFVAGNVDHGTGTRIIDKLGNLRHAMPWTAAAALLAGLSMAGMPLSFGYVVKDAILQAKDGEGMLALARMSNTVFGAVAVAVAAVAAVRVFWHHPGTNVTPEAHEVGPALILPPLLLAIIGMLLGLFPVLANWLVTEASTSMTPGTHRVIVTLTAPLDLDIRTVITSLSVAFAAGAAVFWWWDLLHRLLQRPMRVLTRFGLAAHYDRSLNWIPAAAAAVTRRLQHGSLTGYLALAITTTALAVGAALLVGGELPLPAWETPKPGLAGGGAIAGVGAIVAAVVRKRFVLILGVGLVGYGSAIIFLFAGAPDVALTQFVVETVFVIIAASVLLVLRRHGKAFSVAEPAFRIGALTAAVGFASALVVAMLASAAGPVDSSLPEYFADNSVPAAHGRNVVNVILVDFRAIDTLGEIAVVMLSLLAALPLINSHLSSKEKPVS